MTAIYARQSVERQDSISIEMQIADCKRLLPEQAQTKCYIDRGFSGTNTERPAFQEMLTDIRQGVIQEVCVYKIDRISRSLCDFAGMMRLFRTKQVKLRSVQENFDTQTELGTMLLHLLMMFAELEQKTIAGRVRDNYYARAAQHLPLGGIAPYGYHSVPTTYQTKRTVSLEIIPTEAEQILWFYTQYGIDGKSVEQLVQTANQNGKRTRRGAVWSNSAVLRILRNPLYVQGDLRSCTYLQAKGVTLTHTVETYCHQNGWILYGAKTSKIGKSGQKMASLQGSHLSAGLHRGIVDGRLWLSVQQRLDRRRGGTNRGSGHTSWLQGCVTCGLCGEPCYTRNNGSGAQYTYFICRGKRLGFCQGISALRTSVVESAAVPVLEQCAASVLPFAKIPPQSAPDPVAIQLEELEEKMRRIATELGEISAGTPYLRAELDRLAQTHQALSNTLHHPKKTNPDSIIAWKPWWQQATQKQRHHVSELLLEEIRIFPEHFEIYTKI